MYKLKPSLVLLAVATLVFATVLLSKGSAQNPKHSAGDRITPQNGRLTRVVRQDLTGFIDETGKVIIPPQYQDAGELSQGLIRVERADRWGFIDEQGRTVIPMRFDCADDFSEGLARAVVRNKYGYINRTGRLVIPAKYDLPDKWDAAREAPRFSEELAAILIRHKYGFIDKTGAIVIAPRFQSVEPFSEGLALVTSDYRNFGFIDKSGKMVIAPHFTNARSFSDGLAVVAVQMEQRYKYGYIDKTGEFVIRPQFDDALSFSEGSAPVSHGELVTLVEKPSREFARCVCKYDPPDLPGGVLGGGPAGPPPSRGNTAFIGKDGRPIRDPIDIDIGQFSEGLAPVHYGQGWGYIDNSGTMVVFPQFATAECFNNGLARVRVGHKEVLINHKGEIVWLVDD
jgi:hypothetical protein